MQQEDYLTELLELQGFFVVGMEIEDVERVTLVLGRVGRRIYKVQSEAL